MLVFRARDQAKYFFGKDWTTQISLKWLAKLLDARISASPSHCAIANLLFIRLTGSINPYKTGANQRCCHRKAATPPANDKQPNHRGLTQTKRYCSPVNY